MNTENIISRFVVFCDYALTSSDGKLSIIGEFDQLYTTSDSPVLNKGFIVASLKGVPSQDTEIEINFTGEGGREILPKKNLGITFGLSGVANLMIEISGLSFPSPGIYQSSFKISGKQVAQASLRVVKTIKENTKIVH